MVEYNNFVRILMHSHNPSLFAKSGTVIELEHRLVVQINGMLQINSVATFIGKGLWILFGF